MALDLQLQDIEYFDAVPIRREVVDILGGDEQILWNTVEELAKLYAIELDPQGANPSLAQDLANAMHNDPALLDMGKKITRTIDTLCQ